MVPIAAAARAVAIAQIVFIENFPLNNKNASAARQRGAFVILLFVCNDNLAARVCTDRISCYVLTSGKRCVNNSALV